MRSILCPVSALLALAFAAGAQSQFAERAIERYVPKLEISGQDSASADLDADGDPDVVIVAYQSETRLLLSNGDSVFTDASANLPAHVEDTRAVELGDIDADGDIDIVLGVSGLFQTPALRVYLNDGAANFTETNPANLPASTDRTKDLALLDVESDGDLDIFIATQGQNLLYLNDGSGMFSDVSAVSLPVDSDSERVVTQGDVDGDGDPDLILGYLGQDRLYTNDGSGVFSNAPGRLPFESIAPTALVLVDVDADLDLDLAVSHYSDPLALLINDGSGSFTDRSGTLLPSSSVRVSQLAAGDVDGDGSFDLILGTLNDGQPGLYLNDGSGSFSDATSLMPTVSIGAQALALADFDLDGDLDIFFTEYFAGRLLLNGGSNGFVDASPPRVSWKGQALSLAVGDVDGDGDQDFIAGGGDFLLGGVSQLHRNDGSGIFTTETIGFAENTVDIALGDIDQDGDDDLVCGTVAFGNIGYGSFPTSSTVYENDGSGLFAEDNSALPFETDETYAVELADFDGDGDLDLLTGNLNQQNRMFFNDGSGTFADVTPQRLPPATNATRDIAVGDVDGDGDFDFVAANLNQPNQLYINEGGGGTFFDASAARMPGESRATYGVELGDMDGDGDLDMVFANNGQASLYLNDGTGHFFDFNERFPAKSGQSWSVALGDIEGDGDLDVILGNRGFSGGLANTLYLNDGTARFEDVSLTRMETNSDPSYAVALADLDGDRDPDLLVANGNAPTGQRTSNRLYLNLHRQLEARLLPLIGRSYEVEVHSEPGYAFAPRAVVIAYSTALLPVPVSGVAALNGALYLGLPLTLLPTLVVPATPGSAKLVVSIPSDPSLVGTTFYSQGALFPGAELTGFTRDTIGG